jgi:hypothetical protein
MANCGLWVARSSLWAAVADDNGERVIAFRVARTDDARRGFLTYLDQHGPDCNLVLTDAQARIDNVAQLALQSRCLVWLAPWRSVDAVRAVAGLARGPPKRMAAVLARMLLNPTYRAQLRRLQRDSRQLSLL